MKVMTSRSRLVKNQHLLHGIYPRCHLEKWINGPKKYRWTPSMKVLVDLEKWLLDPKRGGQKGRKIDNSIELRNVAQNNIKQINPLSPKYLS